MYQSTVPFRRFYLMALLFIACEHAHKINVRAVATTKTSQFAGEETEQEKVTFSLAQSPRLFFMAIAARAFIL